MASSSVMTQLGVRLSLITALKSLCVTQAEGATLTGLHVRIPDKMTKREGRSEFEMDR